MLADLWLSSCYFINHHDPQCYSNIPFSVFRSYAVTSFQVEPYSSCSFNCTAVILYLSFYSMSDFCLKLHFFTGATTTSNSVAQRHLKCKTIFLQSKIFNGRRLLRESQYKHDCLSFWLASFCLWRIVCNFQIHSFQKVFLHVCWLSKNPHG